MNLIKSILGTFQNNCKLHCVTTTQFDILDMVSMFFWIERRGSVLICTFTQQLWRIIERDHPMFSSKHVVECWSNYTISLLIYSTIYWSGFVFLWSRIQESSWTRLMITETSILYSDETGFFRQNIKFLYVFGS